MWEVGVEIVRKYRRHKVTVTSIRKKTQRAETIKKGEGIRVLRKISLIR